MAHPISALLRLTSNYDYRAIASATIMPRCRAISMPCGQAGFLGNWVSSANFGDADLALNPYLGKSSMFHPTGRS